MEKKALEKLVSRILDGKENTDRLYGLVLEQTSNLIELMIFKLSILNLYDLTEQQKDEVFTEFYMELLNALTDVGIVIVLCNRREEYEKSHELFVVGNELFDIVYDTFTNEKVFDYNKVMETVNETVITIIKNNYGK